MTNRKYFNCIFKLMLAMILGVFISAFSFGGSTAYASAGEEYVIIDEESVPLADTPEEEDGGGAMIILLGGMLLIILVVVITVVATVISTAPIADEI